MLTSSIPDILQHPLGELEFNATKLTDWATNCVRRRPRPTVPWGSSLVVEWEYPPPIVLNAHNSPPAQSRFIERLVEPANR